jgi:hypothetical protein
VGVLDERGEKVAVTAVPWEGDGLGHLVREVAV